MLGVPEHNLYVERNWIEKAQWWQLTVTPFNTLISLYILAVDHVHCVFQEWGKSRCMGSTILFGIHQRKIICGGIDLLGGVTFIRWIIKR
jgi:hypothetical protein